MGRRKPKKKTYHQHVKENLKKKENLEVKENLEETHKASQSAVKRDNTMLYLGPLQLPLQTNGVVTSTPCTNSSQAEASSRNQSSAKASTIHDAMASCSLKQSETANEFISPAESKNVMEQEQVTRTMEQEQVTRTMEQEPEIEYEVTNSIRYLMTEGDAQFHNLIQGTMNMVADHPGCTGKLNMFRASKRGTGPVCSLSFKCTMCPSYVYKMKI